MKMSKSKMKKGKICKSNPFHAKVKDLAKVVGVRQTGSPVIYPVAHKTYSGKYLTN